MARSQKEEQLEFEGMPVAGIEFELKKVGGLTHEKHQVNDVVGGEWKGHVVGVHHDNDEEAGLIRKQIIVVDKVTIN